MRRILENFRKISKVPRNKKRFVASALLLFMAATLVWPFIFPIRIVGSSLPYEYTIHGTYVEINRYTGNEEEVVVPETIWFRPVTKIGITEFGRESAFDHNETIKSVYIPNSVEEIGIGCFGKCINLEEVHLSDKLKVIRTNAFWGCIALKSINIPDGVEKIEGLAFRKCENLETLILPDTLKIIGGGAFEDCKNLEYVDIPKGVEEIWGNSFKGTEWEKNLGDGFILVGKNVLISYGGQEKIVEVPEGVEYIGDSVFRDCENMEQLVLPESLKKCSNSILVDYDDLKYVICKNPDMEFQEIVYTEFLRRLKPVIVGEKGSTAEAYVAEAYAEEVECTFQDIELWYGESK